MTETNNDVNCPYNGSQRYKANTAEVAAEVKQAEARLANNPTCPATPAHRPEEASLYSCPRKQRRGG